MSEVTSEQLREDTDSILDQIEQGERLLVTRRGKIVARIEPAKLEGSPALEAPPWGEIMAEVWEAQKHIQPSEMVPNPVLEERERRRR